MLGNIIKYGVTLIASALGAVEHGVFGDPVFFVLGAILAHRGGDGNNARRVGDPDIGVRRACTTAN